MNNGKNNWVVKTLVGMVWFCLTTALIIVGNNVIANDKESRIRDEKIKDKVEVCIDDLKKEQKEMRKEVNDKFTEILVALAKLQAAIKEDHD